VPEDIPLADEPGQLTGVAADAAGLVGGDAWATSMRRWHFFYGLIWSATVAEVLTNSLPDRTIGLIALAAMVPWYLFVGRSLMTSDSGSRSRQSLIYLVVLVALFAAADIAAPNTWFLAIALCPHFYHVASARRALTAIVVLSCIGAASSGYWQQGRAGAIVTGICIAIFIIAFSVIYGGYVSGIVTQSSERAALIAQLEATRAELAEVSREAGALAERQRLASEIHDTLAQGFSSILMLVQAAEAQLELSPGAAHRQLELAAQTGTLTEALRRITERAAAELGIDARLQIAGPDRALPAATEVVLLRTGQEALANVRKHASAHAVTVRLCYADDWVRLEVTDDGIGFDPAEVNGGYGLRGMRGRVAEAGGAVTVRSAPGDGTSVLAEVPG
jgi:signal transduction histidine kinase